MAISKKIPLLALLLFSVLLLSAQNPKADAIKKRMTEIRQTTNWKDKEAAAKANQEISKLAKELMMMKAPPEAQQGAPPGQGNAPDEITRQNVESKMALWETIWGAAKKGRDARLDLAKSLRDTIVAEYREDDSPQVKCPEWFNKMNVLYIDMSMPGVEQVISQMERYQAIETLIITGGEHGAPVDLDDLLRRASHYPLKALYIINFRLFVDDIPSSVGGFTGLTEAGFFNNALHSLPPALGSLASLKLLYLDKNPVNTLMPLVASFTNLRTLGLGMTSIPEAEIQTISGLLPECKILR